MAVDVGIMLTSKQAEKAFGCLAVLAFPVLLLILLVALIWLGIAYWYVSLPLMALLAYKWVRGQKKKQLVRREQLRKEALKAEQRIARRSMSRGEKPAAAGGATAAGVTAVGQTSFRVVKFGGRQGLSLGRKTAASRKLRREVKKTTDESLVADAQREGLID